MDILDIFYNEIVPEAALGKVDSFFTYNIIFSTNIEDKEKIEVGQEFEDVMVPTLEINDKEQFDKLLMEYVLIAKDFYKDDYYGEFTSDEEKEKITIKTIIALLFSNMTVEDFKKPCEYLNKRIEFFKNTDLESYDLDDSKLLKSKLSINIKKDNIRNETPYKFSISCVDSKNDNYIFPSLKFGISDGKAYVYAIQKEKDDSSESKIVNRGLYKIGEGFDRNIDNYEIYEEGNLADVTASFVVVANLFCNYLNKVGINEICLQSFLIERWNAKELAYKRMHDCGRINDDVYNGYVSNHVGIQFNLTEKFIRTFIRLTSHYPNIKIVNYPNELSTSLNMDISNMNDCNNSLLNELNELSSKSFDENRKKSV